MQPRGSLGAAGQDEALQLRQRIVVLVAQPLDAVDHRLGHTEALVGAGVGNAKVGAHVEQLVLYPPQRCAQRVGKVGGGERQAELRVELDRPVGGDPAVGFETRTVAQARLARVAAPRVDAGEADWLFAAAAHGRRLGRMEVRLAEPADAEAVTGVLIPSFESLTFLPTLHDHDEYRVFVSGLLEKEEVWVAEDAGRIVGMAALSGDTLTQLYVHPDAQRRGSLGSALLDRAKARRPGGFDLWVFQENVGARRFYERHGLRAVRFTDGSENEEKTPDALYEARPDEEGT